MKKLIFLLCCALWSASLSWAAGGGAPTSAPADLDRIVAVVNDDVILRSELDQDIKEVLAQLKAKGTQLPPAAILERQVLERLVLRRLQLQTAERLGIKVDDATLAKAIDSIAAKNKMSLAQLKGTLEKEHISFDQFRENTKRQIIVAKLQSQEVVNKISITEQEIKNFLAKDSGRLGARAEVHLLHILIATPDGATAEVIQRARAQADQVVQELRRGADFAAVAVRQSGGRQALEGGDLGWLRAGQIPVQVKELVQTMDKGSISDPLRGSEGFHIFKLVDYKGGNRQVVDQTHVRHILVKTNDQVNEQDARTRLEQLRIRLVGGEDFAALARSHSDDPVSAVKGGDLGWLSPGDTVPEFEHQITELRAGDFSQPFRSPQGWHLVQVVERRSHDNTDESMKQKAREAIKERKSNEEIELWLRRLRDESYVEIRLPEAGKPESGRP